MYGKKIEFVSFGIVWRFVREFVHKDLSIFFFHTLGIIVVLVWMEAGLKTKAILTEIWLNFFSTIIYCSVIIMFENLEYRYNPALIFSTAEGYFTIKLVSQLFET